MSELKDYKKKYYGCDGGSVAIGTVGCQVCIPNNYGDGKHPLYVVERDSKWWANVIDKFTWVGAVEGNDIHVYKYDCFNTSDREDPKNTLFKLKGRFGIYVRHGIVVLEQWD